MSAAVHLADEHAGGQREGRPDTDARAPDSEPRGPIASFALKHDYTFLVADALGDIRSGAEGLFRDDTRVLSKLRLTIGGAAPSLLGADVDEDNVFFRANLTNRPLPPLGDYVAPEGVIHLERARLLWDERLYEQLTLTNYGERPVPVALSLAFDADFADIFEGRGHPRAARGKCLPVEVGRDCVRFRYEGLDGVTRASSLSFSRAPDRLAPHEAAFDLMLERGTRVALYLEVGPEPEHEVGRARYREAAARARISMRAKRRRGASLRTSARLFNFWVDKSRADLALLETEMATGPYPFAGIPWFSTTFGRDAIVTALQTLWLDPRRARGVLAFLAETQARETSTFRDCAPGKILHEMRKGEMAALREVPFARYYGGVDSTPLFVMLAGAYARRTADDAFIAQLWPSLVAAMAWIDRVTGAGHDGFLTYARGEATGLANQGWKDSVDSVFHADGRLAEGPIALVEVQGYVYAARRAMAEMAQRRGDAAAHDRALEAAEALRAAVEARFWMPDLGYYALALDGKGDPCRVRASNAGHLLYAGLPSPERAREVTCALFSSAFGNGWGVRTLCEPAVRFNPMSYHNGSVWPHDSGLCAAGMARYGDRVGIRHLLDELFAAAHHFGMRLPELFCGFRRSPGEPPIGYPVACLPQSWSSGAVFMLLQAVLGISIDAHRHEIHIDRPELPGGIEHLLVRGLEVSGERIDLRFERVGERVTVATAGGATKSVDVVIHM
jgi:glycogen debranching enzyme